MLSEDSHVVELAVVPVHSALRSTTLFAGGLHSHHNSAGECVTALDDVGQLSYAGLSFQEYAIAGEVVH